ncbi:MAG: hypothetical protein CMM01_01040 [Rhodopirellula sp.]|nr:hypothetical protein [Rhodopirellula sp.]
MLQCGKNYIAASVKPMAYRFRCESNAITEPLFGIPTVANAQNSQKQSSDLPLIDLPPAEVP